MVDEQLAVRGTIVSHETVRQRTLKFSQVFTNQTRCGLHEIGNKLPQLSQSARHTVWSRRDRGPSGLSRGHPRQR